jgi:hypothetical protein
VIINVFPQKPAFREFIRLQPPEIATELHIKVGLNCFACTKTLLIAVVKS